MRELLGSTKPIGAMKVKVTPRADRGKTRVRAALIKAVTPSAFPGRLVLIAR